MDQAVHHVFERYSIDPGRIGLAGFSDGASYALSLGVANGDLFTHIMAFSPGFMRPPAQVREGGQGGRGARGGGCEGWGECSAEIG